MQKKQRQSDKAQVFGSQQQVRSILDYNKLLNEKVNVKFAGGREVSGTLRGHDAASNLVLEDAEELLGADGQTRKLGLAVARGPAVTVVLPVTGTEEISNPFPQQKPSDSFS